MENKKELFAFSSDFFSIVLNSKGYIKSLINKKTNEDFYNEKNSLSLINLYVNNSVIAPISFKVMGNKLFYTFPQRIEIKISVTENKSYVSFEATELINPENTNITYLLWGPVEVNIKHTIADTLGVVYNDDFAIGLLGLNVKTVAAFPKALDEKYPAASWAETRFPPYYCACIPTEVGGSLRAFTADYTKNRVLNYEGLYGVEQSNMELEKLNTDICGSDGEILGSKIALYGCDTDNVLNIVGEIEVAENLPHPLSPNGFWQKDEKGITDFQMKTDYLFRYFSKDTIDQKIKDARRLNALFLYGHDSFYTYNGDYRILGFKDYVDFKENISDKAKSFDLLVGTKNRPAYLQKSVPNSQGIENILKYMSKAKKLTLKTAIDKASIGQKVVFDGFEPEKIGVYDFAYILIENKELIKVAGDSKDAIIVERACQGTKSSPHRVGASSFLIMFVPYYEEVFIGNQQLIYDAMKTIADSVNTGGMALSDMDGLELSELTGHDIYMFNKTMDWWYNSLNTKRGIKCYASGMTQWVWHISTAQTWGERYLPFTDKTEYDYRLKKNYDYFVRNFYPVTTGLCGITENFTELDVNNLGSKAAAFGTQLNIADEGFTKTKNKDKFLDILREWSSLRDMNALNLDIRKKITPFDARYSIKVVEPMLQWELTCWKKENDNYIESGKEKVKALGLTNIIHNENVKIYSKSFKGELNIIRNKNLSENVSIGQKAQYLVIDLGKEASFDQIRIWHDFNEGKKYRDVVVEISSVKDFSVSEIIFNNDADNSLGLGKGKDLEYSESFVGKAIACSDKKARYIRLWSNGSNLDSYNLYTEVQIIKGKKTFPKPLKRKDRIY